MSNPSSHPLKFFAYSPMFGRSHTTWMGTLSDTLIDQGHEVVIFAPLFLPSNGSHGTTRARIIEYPQCEAAKKRDKETMRVGGTISNFWLSKGTVGSWEAYKPFKLVLLEQLKEILGDKALLERLKAEKFDAGFCECVDFGAMVHMHVLGIKRYSLTISVPTYDWGFIVTGMPFAPSYVPGIMTSSGEKMSFMERVENLRALQYTKGWMADIYRLFDEVAHERVPDFPGVVKMLGDASLVFLNTDPLFDFPRPTVHKVIEIGGITVDVKPTNLDTYFSSILSMRERTVFICFGSITNSNLMPDAWKKTILEVIRRFPEITFIWKYESPNDFAAENVPNLVAVEWAPQVDLLFDPRLSLFVTHAGMGSVNEALLAGVPMVVIPIIGDQYRNAHLIKRTGSGIVFDKFGLSSVSKFESTMREALTNPSYKARAVHNAAMLKNRPFSMKETFVRNMQFMAEYGPLTMLDHYGRHQSFIQYYNLDIIAVPVVIALIIVFFLTFLMFILF